MHARSASRSSTSRIKRVDLPRRLAKSVYRRMEAERKRVANELRSQGFAEAEKIRADADKQRGDRCRGLPQAQQVKGDGRCEGRVDHAPPSWPESREFYAFYRSLEAYRSSFRSKNDMIVVEPNSFSSVPEESPGRGGDKTGNEHEPALLAFALMLILEGVLPFVARQRLA